MRLNRKHLTKRRAERSEIDRMNRLGAVLYRGYFITYAGFRWRAMVEGRRGFLIHTGKDAVLAATLIAEIQSESMANG